MKNLYLISQDKNNDYDTFDSAVVCAESEEKARFIHPRNENWSGIEEEGRFEGEWCLAKYVKVKLIGEAAKDIEVGVVLASFNAG